MTCKSKAPTLPAGLAAGGRSGAEDELLEAGQEEVFSRTEVENGRIEHKSDAGGGQSPSYEEQTAMLPVGLGGENTMTDTNKSTANATDTGDADCSAGVHRPDQNNIDAQGQINADPAAGADGAAGAGGSGGFGT